MPITTLFFQNPKPHRIRRLHGSKAGFFTCVRQETPKRATWYSGCSSLVGSAMAMKTQFTYAAAASKRACEEVGRVAPRGRQRGSPNRAHKRARERTPAELPARSPARTHQNAEHDELVEGGVGDRGLGVLAHQPAVPRQGAGREAGVAALALADLGPGQGELHALDHHLCQRHETPPPPAAAREQGTRTTPIKSFTSSSRTGTQPSP